MDGAGTYARTVKRAFFFGFLGFLGLASACSGSSAPPIPLGTNGTKDGGTTPTPPVGPADSGPDANACEPCQTTPPEGCTGGGPCKCGPPYDCPNKPKCQVGDPEGCPKDEYCQSADCAGGTCVPKGETETRIKDAQCGCDGVTYWNASVAAKRGVSIKNAGACEATAKICGGLAPAPCPEDTHCNILGKDALSCGVADRSGTCWALPQQCPNVQNSQRVRLCLASACIEECDAIRGGDTNAWYDATCP